MSSFNGASPSPRNAAPPHIRLNSGTDNIALTHTAQQAQSAAQQTSRSLIPPTVNSPSIRSQPSQGSIYNQAGPAESAELLLPPKKLRTRRFRDEDSPLRSPLGSEFSSRRSSWSSESVGSRDSRMGTFASPFASPFDDSRAPSRAGSDDDTTVNTQTVSEKYNILPSAGLLLFPEDVEKDDWLHNPDPNDKDRECDIFTKRGFVNVGGLALITLGVLTLFIGYPIITYLKRAIDPVPNACASSPLCIDVGDVPLLKNVRSGLIDPATPDSVKTRTDSKGKKQVLVFSDEFNTDGRTFYAGDDAYFQGVDIWYGVTRDLEWYDPDAITTKDGVLELRFDAFENHNLNYRSGMLQSWNQLCYKGGYLEASISLPGRGDTIGFWPGFWAMGNLGRPGYAATTEGLWPYSYHDKCDAGITANQSQTDGLSNLPGMRLPACTCTGEDHPNPGISRSAPEIDAIEASVSFLEPANQFGIGSASQSAQFAPFDIFWQPDLEFTEIYDHTVTGMNGYQGGVYQQAVSGVSNLNNDWYDGKSYQTYGFEYEPGDSGYVTWYIGKDKTWSMDAKAVGPNGNVGQRVIPQEPMALIANFGMSSGFAALNMTGLGPLMPAIMRFDFIRIYQDEDNQLVTCDPPDYPTTDYIKNHPEPYYNPNLTLWEHTKYDWPKNSLVNDCKAANYKDN